MGLHADRQNKNKDIFGLDSDKEVHLKYNFQKNYLKYRFVSVTVLFYVNLDTLLK